MENKIKRAVIMCEDKYISSLDLALSNPGMLSINLRSVRQEAERTAIKQALSMTEGNYSAVRHQRARGMKPRPCRPQPRARSTGRSTIDS
jgi:hypothetical protein